MDGQMLRAFLNGVGSVNATSNSSTPQRATSSTDSNKSLKSIVSGLVMDRVMQQRVTHIAFGCVSAALAVFVVFRIWRDSWRASKLQAQPRARKLAFLYNIHPAESFPLILGFAIFWQQILFIGVQASSLRSITVSNCRNTSQFIFPAIFLLGYLHFIFGLEMTIRSLKRTPFGTRPRFVNTLCLTLVTLMVVGTFVVARTGMPDNRKCFGNLIFRVSPRELTRAVIGILSVMIASFVAMAGIIALQLLRTVTMDPSERIAGSRMVYYLLATAVSHAMVAPFFVQIWYETLTKDLTSASVGEFALFASGTVIAFIHIFLRANAGRTAIKPRETPWQPRRRLRLFGPNELEIMNISPPLNLVNPNYDYNSDEKVADIYARKQRHAPKAYIPETPLPEFSFPAKSQKPTNNRPEWPLSQQKLASPVTAAPRREGGHRKHQPSYSLFPGPEDVKLPDAVYSPPGPSSGPSSSHPALQLDVGTLSSKTYQPLSAPANNTKERSLATGAQLSPPNVPWAPRFHRRGSSADSSATVQIGIRLSAAPSTLAAANRRSSLQLPQKLAASNNPFSAASQPPGATLPLPLFTKPSTFQPSPQRQVMDADGGDLDAFNWATSPNDDIERQDDISEPLFEIISPRGARRLSASRKEIQSVYSQASSVSSDERRRRGWI